TPVIYDTVLNGDREDRVVNQEATLAAREKQKLIKEQFRAWLFSDPERTERLVRLYNDAFNNLRPRLFDGSHLDFPCMNQTIQLPLTTPSRWTPLALSVFLHCVVALLLTLLYTFLLFMSLIVTFMVNSGLSS